MAAPPTVWSQQRGLCHKSLLILVTRVFKCVCMDVRIDYKCTCFKCGFLRRVAAVKQTNGLMVFSLCHGFDCISYNPLPWLPQLCFVVLWLGINFDGRPWGHLVILCGFWWALMIVTPANVKWESRALGRKRPFDQHIVVSLNIFGPVV